MNNILELMLYESVCCDDKYMVSMILDILDIKSCNISELISNVNSVDMFMMLYNKDNTILKCVNPFSIQHSIREFINAIDMFSGDIELAKSYIINDKPSSINSIV